MRIDTNIKIAIGALQQIRKSASGPVVDHIDDLIQQVGTLEADIDGWEKYCEESAKDSARTWLLRCASRRDIEFPLREDEEGECG